MMEHLGGCCFCVYELASTLRVRGAVVPIATREVATLNGTRALCDRHAASALRPLSKAVHLVQLDLFTANEGAKR
jgi:hypothetical protein